jgi:hypothetical protein
MTRKRLLRKINPRERTGTLLYGRETLGSEARLMGGVP